MATLMSCDVMIHDDSERDTNSNVAMAINFIFINVTPPSCFQGLFITEEKHNIMSQLQKCIFFDHIITSSDLLYAHFTPEN
jgi:hypothetical protein